MSQKKICIIHPEVSTEILPCPYHGCTTAMEFFVCNPKSNFNKYDPDSILEVGKDKDIIKYKRCVYLCGKCNRSLWQWVKDGDNEKTMPLPKHECFTMDDLEDMLINKQNKISNLTNKDIYNAFLGEPNPIMWNGKSYSTYGTTSSDELQAFEVYRLSLTPFDIDFLKSCNIDGEKNANSI